jgi:hypothetical protein
LGNDFFKEYKDRKALKEDIQAQKAEENVTVYHCIGRIQLCSGNSSYCSDNPCSVYHIFFLDRVVINEITQNIIDGKSFHKKQVAFSKDHTEIYSFKD